MFRKILVLLMVILSVGSYTVFAADPPQGYHWSDWEYPTGRIEKGTYTVPYPTGTTYEMKTVYEETCYHYRQWTTGSTELASRSGTDVYWGNAKYVDVPASRSWDGVAFTVEFPESERTDDGYGHVRWYYYKASSSHHTDYELNNKIYSGWIVFPNGSGDYNADGSWRTQPVRSGTEQISEDEWQFAYANKPFAGITDEGRCDGTHDASKKHYCSYGFNKVVEQHDIGSYEFRKVVANTFTLNYSKGDTNM